MTKHHRRDFLRGVAAAAGATVTTAMFPPVLRKALAIPANRKHGDIRDVEHIVILMQENRSFDHYFGTLPGVRGFGDRFPIPVPDVAGVLQKKTVWYQSNLAATSGPQVIAPFRLNTTQKFDYMRVEGTPHTWPDAQNAWNDGKLNEWPRYKNNHSLGYFTEEDIPFQFAMADAFTICDAYHCAFQGGTNPNRVFLWTGGNDPLKRGNGPVLYNNYDNFENDPDNGYTWTTYPERLEKAGISWQVYQNLDDNFTDNPLAGFRKFRDAHAGLPGSSAVLRDRGVGTRDLDKLKEDVLNGKLPQVSWIVATAEGSEHPGPSSPAQGADYTARVLEALTADPEVWSKTVLFVNFDENDGFFDHVPPPAAPSYVVFDQDPKRAQLAGGSTVDTTGEYHEFPSTGVEDADQLPFHKPYGCGPRVPLYVLSPWSKGGWVNSQVADHTSVIRFVERRFGVNEPNITPWRRAVCSDLTSAFNFANPDAADFEFPDTTELAERARALPGRTTPETPAMPALPSQETGMRRSRALPYELYVSASLQDKRIRLLFESDGKAAAVFHVYDMKHLDAIPRRYTVESRKQLAGVWDLTADGGVYDLWILGPNGFHRRFAGDVSKSSKRAEAEVILNYDADRGGIELKLRTQNAPATFKLVANAYYDQAPIALSLPKNGQEKRYIALRTSANWYDYTVTVDELPGFVRRFAGRVETGKDSWSDPAQGGPAIGDR